MRGLDHIVLAVHELDESKLAFERLGYTTTPNALHPWGTGNSLIQLQRNFIELLDISQPARIEEAGNGDFSFGAFNRDFLKRQQGMTMLVFSSQDAAADQARWTAAGLHTWPLFDFSRTATLPDGTQVKVAFTLAFVTHPQMPDAAWFVCQQHYPENFWKPQYQRHANGANALQQVWMQAENPAHYSDFLAALFDGGTVSEQEDDSIVLTLDYGCVNVCTPRALRARFADLPLPSTANGPRFAALTLSGQHTVPAQSLHGLIVEQHSS